MISLLLTTIKLKTMSESIIAVWRRERDTPGILFSKYKGKLIKVTPVGSTEYDIYIDDKWYVGSDDIQECFGKAIKIIDGTYTTPNYNVTIKPF